MRKLIAAAVGMLALILGGAAPATATGGGESESTIVSNPVVGAPDNDCPTAWARDTFTRTLTITPEDVNEYGWGKYLVHSDVAGIFDDVDPAGVDGTIYGYIEYAVWGKLSESKIEDFNGETVDLTSYGCKADVPFEHKAPNWAINYFKHGAIVKPITDWSYTYTTACEQFTEEDGTDAVGADTFSPCPVPTEPTVTHPTCDASGYITIPVSEDYAYLLGGQPVEAADHEQVPGTYTVEAWHPEFIEIGPAYPDIYSPAGSWELTVNAAPSEEECNPPGDEDGTEDGTDDGAEDGTEDGTEDGAEDGTEDGAEDGAEDGTDDGTDAGTEDGDEDGTPTPTPDPTQDPTTAPTEPPTGDDDGTDEDLPDTGTSGNLLLGTGVGLLIVGGLAFAATRYRRQTAL